MDLSLVPNTPPGWSVNSSTESPAVAPKRLATTSPTCRHARNCSRRQPTQVATGIPLVYTYVLGPVARAYRDGDVFTGVLKVPAHFPAALDIGQV